jgi:DNA-binding transcriptional ArsR family regulator
MFDALSQETRLRAFKLLVQAGPEGLAAGKVSEELDVPHNTMSFHLNHLSHAGIIQSTRQGRSIIYSACYDKIQGLIEYMVSDCCTGPFATIKRHKTNKCSVIELNHDACCLQTNTKENKS